MALPIPLPIYTIPILTQPSPTRMKIWWWICIEIEVSTFKVLFYMSASIGLHAWRLVFTLSSDPYQSIFARSKCYIPVTLYYQFSSLYFAKKLCAHFLHRSNLVFWESSLEICRWANLAVNLNSKAKLTLWIRALWEKRQVFYYINAILPLCCVKWFQWLGIYYISHML